jgi:hypothetical protein
MSGLIIFMAVSFFIVLGYIVYTSVNLKLQ